MLAGLFGATRLGLLASRQTGDLGAAMGLKAVRLLAFALVPIGALVIVSSGTRMISAGYVGVALLFGKVRPVALQEGINLVNPLYDVIQMDTRLQKQQAKYDAAGKDLRAVHVEMVLNCRLTPDKATGV